MHGGLEGSTLVTSTPAGGGMISAPAMTSPIFTALPAMRPTMMASRFLIFGFIILLHWFCGTGIVPRRHFKEPCADVGSLSQKCSEQFVDLLILALRHECPTLMGCFHSYADFSKRFQTLFKINSNES
jgi:hypothetical protein